MIRINLLPLKEAEREAGKRQERVVGTGVVAVVVLLLVFFALQQNRALSQAKSRVQALEEELNSLSARNKEVVELEAVRKQAQDKLKTIADLDKRRVGPVEILRDLSEAIPMQAWLTEFSDAGGSATITGLALDNQTVAMFARRLSASPHFIDVDPVETTQTETEGVKLKKFVLKSRVEYFQRDGEANPSSGRGRQPRPKGESGV